MNFSIQDLLAAPPIMGVTINTVMLPPSFSSLLYYCIAGVFLGGTILFVLNKYPIYDALKKAAIASLLASGILSAIQSDYVWSTWLTTDARAFSGLSTNDKLVRLEGGMVDFARVARERLGGDYMLYSSQDYLALRLEYFLLPKRKRQEAQYIVVIADEQSNYDQTTKTFSRGDTTIRPVEPLLVYARNAYILKRTAL